MKTNISLFCFLAVMLLACVSSAAKAQAVKVPFTFALADDAVRITTGFTGTELVIFGTANQQGTVILLLEGPHKTAIVRRKESILGAWMNRGWLYFDDLPVYYDFASSSDVVEALPDEAVRKDLLVGLKAMNHIPRKKRYDDETVKAFQEALIRNKQVEGLYPVEPKEVKFLADGFFTAKFVVPANVPSGDYKVRGLLVRNGQVVHEHVEEVHIGLEGFSSRLYVFSKDYAFFYGLLCVLLAVMAGWLSNALVRRS